MRPLKWWWNNEFLVQRISQNDETDDDEEDIAVDAATPGVLKAIASLIDALAYDAAPVKMSQKNKNKWEICVFGCGRGVC